MKITYYLYLCLFPHLPNKILLGTLNEILFWILGVNGDCTHDEKYKENKGLR